jgi:hypothetical protein
MKDSSDSPFEIKQIGQGKKGEMTQTLYAHMNKRNKFKKNKYNK